MRILALLVALLFGIPAAQAQSTASQVVTGYLTNTGCPSPTSPQAYCFVQYGAGGGGVAANVNITAINGTTVPTGAGVPDGSMRVTESQDTTTIAGSAPGTAGTASANVVTVQGVSGMTPVAVSQAPSSSSTLGIAPIVSTSLESTHVLKNAPGNLYDLYVTTGGISGYLMVFNATSAPADGAVTPIDCIAAPANATTSLFSAGSPPEVYSTGISVAFSAGSNCFTKTASATAFFHGRVQ